MATRFSKYLTERDVIGNLSIPTSYIGIIPFEEGRSVDMHVHDDSGKLWVFRCSVQRSGIAGRVLCVDWLEFVRQKNVKVDDKVIFTEEITRDQGVEARILKIEVKRKIRLFGHDIWANVK